ncbi:hypothetical protein BTH41_04846 [Bacillus mycoides]|nr:hypothetical protein BTH41_04846 [Bacillus mycoides]
MFGCLFLDSLYVGFIFINRNHKGKKQLSTLTAVLQEIKIIPRNFH